MPQWACCCNFYLNALTSQEGEDVPQRGMLYFYLNALTSQEGEDAPPKGHVVPIYLDALFSNTVFER